MATGQKTQVFTLARSCTGTSLTAGGAGIRRPVVTTTGYVRGVSHCLSLSAAHAVTHVQSVRLCSTARCHQRDTNQPTPADDRHSDVQTADKIPAWRENSERRAPVVRT